MEFSRRTFLQHASFGVGAAAALVAVPATAKAFAGGGVRRYRLEARPSAHQLGTTMVETLSYNGSLPGPLLRARVGDRITVDFVNGLSEPSTIHWHGVEVPATADGSNISQVLVPPGGTYQYNFVALRPGLFWYHPHANTNETVERGLYGALLIEDPNESGQLGVRPGHEHVLLLDDVLIEDAAIAPAFPSDPLENALTHFNGRIGNVLLVNGENRPTIRVRNGMPQRLRLVNTANSRFMRVAFPEGQRVWRVGGDGGFLEAPLTIDAARMPSGHGGHGDGDGGHGDGGHGDGDGGGHGGPGGLPMDLGGLMLTPGERADLVWIPSGDRGDVVSMSWYDTRRGDHGAKYADDGSIMITHDAGDGMDPPEVLIDFQLRGQQAPSAGDYSPPSSLRSIDRLVPSGDPIALTMGHGPADPAGEVTFFMQRNADGPQPFPALGPDDVATVSPGDVRMIEVTNLTMGSHNFHLHGFFFQLVETQFFDMDNPENNVTIPAPYLEDKDTILIPGRPGAGMRSRTVVRLAASFDDTGREGQIDAWGKVPSADQSGGWLMHCHLLEHSDSGMLSFVQVRS